MSRFSYTPKDAKWYREMTRRINEARRELAFAHGNAVLHIADCRAKTRAHREILRLARALINTAMAASRSSNPVREVFKGLSKLKMPHRENPIAKPGGMDHRGDCEHYFEDTPCFYRGGTLKGPEPIRGIWDERLERSQNVIARGVSEHEGRPDIEIMSDKSERKVYRIIDRHYGIPEKEKPAFTDEQIDRLMAAIRSPIIPRLNGQSSEYKLIRIAKSNYKSRSGKVKPGILIDGDHFAPYGDLCESETEEYALECSSFDCKYSPNGVITLVRSVYPPTEEYCHQCGSRMRLADRPI